MAKGSIVSNAASKWLAPWYANKSPAPSSGWSSTPSSSSSSSGATTTVYKSNDWQSFSNKAAADAANARVASLKQSWGVISPTTTPTTPTWSLTFNIYNPNTGKTTTKTMTQSAYDSMPTATKSALQASISAWKSSQVDQNSKTVTSVPTQQIISTPVVAQTTSTKSLIPSLNFGWTVSQEEQATRNADIAKKFSTMAGDLTGKTEQEKKDAVTEFLKTDLWLDVDTNNTNRKNTIDKITWKVSAMTGTGILPEQPKATQEEIDAGKNLEEQSNKITDNQFTDMTNNLNNLRDYITTIADPGMQKVIADRMANITDAQGKIQDAINLMDDSKQRIIRLQSNDAIEWITKQYMAKGLTEEEARAQGQSDLNKQVMNERQTLLQAQANTAALNKDLLTWVANAQDTIQVAKNANIQYDTNLESTLTQLKADIINNKYASEKSAFDTYVGSTVTKAFNDMSAIEKAQLMKIADADTLDSNKTVAITTLLSSVGSLLSTRSWAIFKAIQWIKDWTMDYATALATVVGNNGTPGAWISVPAAATPTAKQWLPTADRVVGQIADVQDASKLVNLDISWYSASDQAKINKAIHDKLLPSASYIWEIPGVNAGNSNIPIQ